jgi:murein DD-endopeptidase MepM/ murein hydrolase activator NlpD
LLNLQDTSNNIIKFLSYTFLALILLIGVIFFSTKPLTSQNELSNTTNSNHSQDYILQDLVREVIVVKGDTLNNILLKNNISNNEALNILKALKAINYKAHLQIGQKISLDYDVDESLDEVLRQVIKKITIFTTATTRIELNRIGNNFIAKEIHLALHKVLITKTIVIKHSLIQSLRELGLKRNLAQDLTKNYSYHIDFQREIKPGDKITLIIENYFTPDSKKISSENILYSSLQLGEKEYKIYRYAPKDMSQKYYSEDGKSIKRNLLKTPLSTIRISSHFGKVRTHTKGFSYKHKGVDFAAPVGTPILSSGDGIVSYLGWKSGYGKCIKINHDNNIATFYAHLDSFPKNLKLGSKVHQGQVIGKIGMTGRTTGPHLHHEVLVGGIQVDPMKMHYSIVDGLHKNQLEEFRKFKVYVASLSKQFASGTTEIKIN